jgi:hypothetical protein
MLDSSYMTFPSKEGMMADEHPSWRNRKSPVPDSTEGIVYTTDTCGRCSGAGQLMTYNAVTMRNEPVWCPICKGTGQAQHFQSHGNPNIGLPTYKRFAP